MDSTVGSKCLSSLLGVGQSRLRKAAGGVPDLRYGKKAHQSKPGTWTVDAFLQVSYDSVAETLPDRCLEWKTNLSFKYVVAKQHFVKHHATAQWMSFSLSNKDPPCAPKVCSQRAGQ